MDRMRFVHKDQSFVQILCFLAGYDRFVAHLIWSNWPIWSNILATLFLAKYSLNDGIHITTIPCMAGTKHPNRASIPCIAILSFLRRKIYDTTMEHLDTCRDVMSTSPDNNTASIISCCTPSIVSEMYVEPELPANMLQKAFLREYCHKWRSNHGVNK